MAISGTSWVKGQSGNPAGRAKSEYALRDYARTFTEEALQTIVGIMRDERASADVRLRAAETLLNRGWGRAPQSVALEAGPEARLTLAHIVREVNCPPEAAQTP